MDEQDPQDFTDADDDTDYAQLDELEKLETIIAYMDELGIATLEAARTRYAALERAIDSNDAE